MILAAILLKMGGYGFLRFSLPMFPLASQEFAPLIFALSVIAIVYTSLVALVQEDMKKLIAYSSVAHMGFVTMGIFAATTQGIAGGIFQMVSHGIVSGALFLSVGVVYDRMHTREIAAYGGLVNRMPLYAAAFMVFTLANVGLPGTSGFVGEFLTLIGTFKVNIWIATLATIGVILSAGYALWLYRKVIFGALDKPKLAAIKDLDYREIDHARAAGGADHPVRRLSRSRSSTCRPPPVTQLIDEVPAGARRAPRPRPCWCNDRANANDAMNETFEFDDLLPVLPEIVLAVGAMVLLMVGAFRGERCRRRDQLARDPAADRRRRDRRLAAGRAAGRLRRQLRARSVRALPQAPGADRLRDRDPDVARLPRDASSRTGSNIRS